MVLHFLFDFQALIAGVLAVVAAVFTAGVVWRSAKLPLLEQQRVNREVAGRRKLYVCVTLSSNFAELAARARQAEGTIKVVIAANANVSEDTRQKTRLKLHPMIDDWEAMSLLPPEVQRRIMTLSRKIQDHNFDMDRAGGAFGSNEFRVSVLNQVKSIQGFAAGLSALLEREYQTVGQ